MKKEIRIIFNFDNDKERELYAFLMSKTTASGYIKDLIQEHRENNQGLKAVVDAINNLSKSFSNITVGTGVTEVNEEISNELVCDNIEDLEIDFDDDIFD